jgi:hypothetical protein
MGHSPWRAEKLTGTDGHVPFSLDDLNGHSEIADVVADEMIHGLLSELDDEDVTPEHGDVWLMDEDSGWTVGVFAGDRQMVVLQDTATGGESFHRTGVSRMDAFTLLRRLADGELEAIRREDWGAGYGSD